MHWKPYTLPVWRYFHRNASFKKMFVSFLQVKRDPTPPSCQSVVVIDTAMWSVRVLLVTFLAVLCVQRCAAHVRLRDEFVWGNRDDRTDRVCFSQSVVIDPTWEAFFAFFRPVTRLVTFIPPRVMLCKGNAMVLITNWKRCSFSYCHFQQPDQVVRYIRVWTDAPWYRFRAELLHGGVGTKAPIITIIQLSRHWLLFANVVIYCSTVPP